MARLAASLLAVVTIGAVLLPSATEAGPVASSANAARSDKGLPPLAEHSGLDGIAGRHARNMADRGSLFHIADLAGAVSTVVPSWTRVGQNVGVGTSLAEVERMLLASAEHRSNILGDFNLIGSGAVTGGDGRVWVSQVFAKASEQAPPTAATTMPPPAPAPASAPGPAPASAPAPAPTSEPTRVPPAPRASRSEFRTAAAAPVVPVEQAASRRPRLAIAESGIVAAASPRPAPGSWARRWTRSSRTGYWLVGADGGVFGYGRVPHHQSLANQPINAPVVDFAPAPSGRGYWLATADGGVFAFGKARYLDSVAGQPLRAPVVALAPNRSGSGYWLVAGDGGVFAFGAAPYLGSVTEQDLQAPVVGLAPTPSGKGYWLVAADGGVYAFGDAGYAGGLSGQDLTAPVVGLEPTRSGRGYRIVSADGGVFAFGDASFEGSLAGQPVNDRIVDLDATASGGGYRLVAADGGVFAFGDATFAGSVAGQRLNGWVRPR